MTRNQRFPDSHSLLRWYKTAGHLKSNTEGTTVLFPVLDIFIQQAQGTYPSDQFCVWLSKTDNRIKQTSQCSSTVFVFTFLTRCCLIHQKAYNVTWDRLSFWWKGTFCLVFTLKKNINYESFFFLVQPECTATITGLWTTHIKTVPPPP